MEAISAAQRGLLMRPVFGEVVTIRRKQHSTVDFKAIVDAIRTLAINAATDHADCGLVAAFNPELWGKWTNRTIPIRTEVLVPIISTQTAALGRGTKFVNTGGDILLYVKAPSHEVARELVETVKMRLAAMDCEIDTVVVGKRSDGRIMAGRYLDGITNPNDPVSLTEDILLDGKYAGACFGFTQKFSFDWPSIASQAPDTQDEMIGRDTEGAVLSQHAALGHIHRASVRDSNGDQRKLMRQALPFGVSGHNNAREEGLMFVAFCNDQERFETVLSNLLGKTAARPQDRLMDVVQGEGGAYWYVPSATELDVPAYEWPGNLYEDQHWSTRSSNGYLFYNSQDYLHQMAEGRYVGGDPPSSRLLSLMGRTFNHWLDGWLHRQHMPRLQHLDQLATEDERQMLQGPIPVRKGLANFKTLAHLFSSPDSAIAHRQGLLRIEARELLVGVIPDFTLGRGKEVVPYLNKDETINAWLKGQLNEWSAMGHVIPNYERLVSQGLGQLITELQSRLKQEPKSAFYQAAITSLEGVQAYLRNWALIAEQQASSSSTDADNMRDVAQRLRRLADQAPQSFQDAVQLIFSFHCCLHLVGELTSFGRLDQILWPFLQRDSISVEYAQDIMDCLWIKIGENAFVDRAFIYDYMTYGTTSVCGVGGNFPQGGGINQWVQQITVGGYKKSDCDQPEPGANPVTMLCLKSARRIPVNAPTLSLRVYPGMPDELLEEAAKSILAGGAQPILYNDSRLCEALYRSGPVGRAESRNYAADGCYEPLFAGASDFAFNNVQPMLALEQTINQGATYGAAGPEQLRGMKETFRSPPAAEITTFEQLQSVFLEQLEWLVVGCYNLLLGAYGNLADICPSPLLSVLIDGCCESGRDLTGGGSRFHIMAPLCIGVSNTIDSLYAIQKLVYDPDTACTTLPELVNCLINDWGFNMIEPYQNQQMGSADSAQHARRYQELRQIALALPKWGSGDSNVDALGDWLIENLVRLCVDVVRQPHPALKSLLEGIKKNFGPEFEFVITPGVGTFEGYVGDGVPCGASADGRRNTMPIASDLSPVPAPQDLPPMPAFRNIYQAMKSWHGESLEMGFSNAAPVDMNIPEDFPLDKLTAFIRAYANGDVGGNLLTLTCADLATYQAAVQDPERYNLIRVRMGGWTEFYATMFPGHQDQHQRRQYFTPNGSTVVG